MPREADDRPWWHKVALETLRRGASPPPAFDDAAWFEDLYARFSQPGVWLLHDDVIPSLDRLGRHARLAVISNFDGRLRTILTGLGVASRFEQLFISSEMGAEKPSEAIFQKAMQIMQAAPSDCLHVGDDPEKDGAGARAAGLSAILIDRPETTLEHVAPLYV
jgi:putative hydrolase of the HAD superfamily